MPVKSDFKVVGKRFLISAPRGLDLLPGRLVRKMVKSLERQYEICEYSLVKGHRAADAMEDVVGKVELQGGMGSWLFGTQPIVVFQKLHPSIYQPDFIQLSEDEIMDFQSRLPDEEPFIKEDFTLSMPADYYLAVSNNMKKLIKILGHLKLDGFDAFQEAIRKLSTAAIVIYDEADMFVEYNDDAFPAHLTEDVEEWLNAPEEVDELEF